MACWDDERDGVEYSHEEVVRALLELVEEGDLLMGVDDQGASIFWFTEQGVTKHSREAVAVR